MNSGAVVESTREIRDVAVSSISPSLTNPRKSIDQAQLEELAQSIRTSGIKVPLSLLVTRQGFEIIGGERRWRAAKLAGLSVVPAVVYKGLSEEDAHDARMLENLQRQDLAALDEAEAYQEMFHRAGSAGKPLPPADLAAKIGKSESYVRLRLRLLSAPVEVKEALRAEFITVGHALELARLEPSAQKDLLEWLQYDVSWDGKRGNKRNAAPSVAELRRNIAATIMLDLTKAPFDAKDAKLCPAAGACVDCKKRTGNNQMLFADVKKGDTCTDPRCFEAKIAAHIEGTIEKLAKRGKKVQRISSQYDGHGLANGAISRRDYESLDDHYKNPKQDCDAAVVGIYVDGDRRGKTVRICTDKKCCVHSYSSAAGSSSSDDAKKRAAARIEKSARERIFLAALNAAKDLEMEDRDYLAIAEYSIHRADSNGTKRMAAMLGWPKETFGYGKNILREKLEEAGVERAVAIARLASVSGYLTVGIWGDGKCAGLEAVAKDYGVDVKKIRETVKAEADAKAKKKTSAKPAAKGQDETQAPPAKKGQKSKAARLSPETRQRIAAAQKKRVEKAKKASEKAVTK